MNSIYYVITVIIVILVFLKILDYYSKKAILIKNRKNRQNTIDTYIKELINIQDILYKKYIRISEKTQALNDKASYIKNEKIGNVLNSKIHEFNKNIEKIQYYEDAIEQMTILWDAFNKIDNLLDEIEENIKDLRYTRYSAEDDIKVSEPKNIISFQNSKYFKGCKNKDELTKRYKQLVKIYHPDNGGKETEFIKLKEEYERCIKTKNIS